jgi:hypothetical protein
MNWQRIWNDPVWSKVIAGVILGAGALAYPLIPRNPLYISILGSIVLLGVSLLAWTLLRAPVAWNFGSFLGMVGGGGELRVISFQANGRNRSGKGLNKIQGHLVSNIDNSISEQLHFVIDGIPVLPSSTTGIPPGADFQIMIPLCDRAQGYEAYLKEHDFMQQWSAFHFVVELNGDRYEHTFSKRRVVGMIEKFRSEANPQSKPQVRIKL